VAALNETFLFNRWKRVLMLDRKKITAAFPKMSTALMALNFPPAVVYYAQRGDGGSPERR
jgi:hypothetical protein